MKLLVRQFKEARGATLKRSLQRGSRSRGMPNVLKLLNNARKSEEGAALVEYALLIGLIAVVCIIAVTQLGLAVSTTLSTACSSIGGTSC
jgi:pilus assembly protein Flp/PilA